MSLSASSSQPYWPPIQQVLSVDLLHAILQDKVTIAVSTFESYLFHCCGIKLTVEKLNALFECQESEIENALSVGLKKHGIAVVEQKRIFYLDTCDRLLPITAYPVEDTFNIILSIIRETPGILMSAFFKKYKSITKELTVETLNSLFRCDFKCVEEALRYGLREFVLFSGTNKFSVRITYLKYPELNFATKKRMFYQRVKDEMLALLKKKECLFDNEMGMSIFQSHGIMLDLPTLCDIYGSHESLYNVYVTAFEGFAYIAQATTGRYPTYLFESIGKPSILSLRRASKLKPFVLLHDGYAGYTKPMSWTPTLDAFISWHSTKRETEREAADFIRTSFNLDWSDVRLVFFCFASLGFMRNKTTLPWRVEQLKKLVQTINEKTANRCELHLSTIPIHPDPEKNHPESVQINELLVKLADEIPNLQIFDVNEQDIKHSENWKSNAKLPVLKSRVTQRIISEFMLKKRDKIIPEKIDMSGLAKSLVEKDPDLAELPITSQ
ncbi:hypothetical protein QR680_009935 [Steinernema hermaphroditum]|uniref:Uncharacterized protein n=1 Tax=Steinernema hermaphroditum TaxID=289476 RepID=A0AA39INE5_9BILA|nr:hypothetical protein QR680_009935 [Steinernema hermaphroditum]